MPFIDSDTAKDLDRLQQLIDTHGTVISNALRVYSERMRKDGERTMAEYTHVKQCPMATAQLEKPGSIMTVEGLRMSAEMILQAADRADDAYKDLESIENGPYDDEEDE